MNLKKCYRKVEAKKNGCDDRSCIIDWDFLDQYRKKALSTQRGYYLYELGSEMRRWYTRLNKYKNYYLETIREFNEFLEVLRNHEVVCEKLKDNIKDLQSVLKHPEYNRNDILCRIRIISREVVQLLMDEIEPQ